MAKNEDKRKLLLTLGSLSTVGISVVIAIVIGVFAGLKLDEWLDTKPWFFFTGLFFGIAAGFRNIQIMVGKELKRNDSDREG